MINNSFTMHVHFILLKFVVQILLNNFFFNNNIV